MSAPRDCSGGNAKPLPPLNYLNECFTLDPDVPSGLRWRNRPLSHFKNAHRRNNWNAHYSGKMAGTLCSTRRYLQIRIDGLRYMTHRVVFALAHMKLPPASLRIDHVDGNPLNNNPNNLRLATNAENLQNRTGLELRNSSGVTGVGFHNAGRKWYAQIRVNGKTIHLGLFDAFEEAVMARRAAELRYYGEFAPPFDESVLLQPVF